MICIFCWKKNLTSSNFFSVSVIWRFHYTRNFPSASKSATTNYYLSNCIKVACKTRKMQMRSGISGNESPATYQRRPAQHVVFPDAGARVVLASLVLVRHGFRSRQRQDRALSTRATSVGDRFVHTEILDHLLLLLKRKRNHQEATI